jgi:thiol-disulfide isomerase/thioredoxin
MSAGPAARQAGGCGPRCACAALLLLSIFFAAGCSEPGGAGEGSPSSDGSQSAGGDRERRVAPEFVLESLDGGSVRLADLRGKTVVIDFWATWCPPCEFQVPELNAFWKEHGADGDVVVLGISVDVEGPEVVRAWVEERSVEYPILVGGEDLARRFGAIGFPTLYVISPDGTIESEHIGLIEVGKLETALDRHRQAEAG